VELVREEPHASTEEGAEAIGFANGQQVQDVDACHEILDRVEIAERQAFEERAFELQRPQVVGREGLPVRKAQRPIREPCGDCRLFPRGGDPDRPARAQVNGDQRVRVGRQPELRPRARELDDDRAAFAGRDASDPQLGVVAMGEVVPRFPGARRC